MRRIVVGFDGSDGAANALAWAVAESRLRDAAVTVCAVVHDDMAVLASVPEIHRDLERQVRRLAAGTEVEYRGLSGAPARALTAACDTDDLLVLGSRGLNRVTGLLLGSVSRACLHHAICPVVVVRHPPPDTPHGRVIAGIDGSGNARRALRVAAEEAGLRGAVLHAVNVVRWDHLGAALVAPSTHQLLAWGRELVHKELMATGVDARAIVVNGHPPQVLVRRGRHADVLVLGSRGVTSLPLQHFGSTSAYCARHASGPVMIVPPDPDDPD